MNKCIYKGVDIFNPLDGNMKYFIDAFAKVYGEKHRPAIEKRLKNAKYFFLGGDFDFIIQNYKQRMQEEIDKINSYTITDNLKKLKILEVTARYQHIINIFQNSIKKSQEIENRYKNARSDLLLKHINSIRKKNKLPLLDSALANIHINTLYEILVIGPDKLKTNKILFSEQKKQQYIQLFNTMGYNAKNFDAYLKNKKLLNNIFDLNLITTLNHWYQTQNQEENTANICSADLIKQLDALQIYGGDDAYINIGTQYIKGQSPNSAFAISCLSKTSGFTALCFCKNAINLSLDDLTHEMGHIIDAFVVKSDQQGFYHKSGFELHYHPLDINQTKKLLVPLPDEHDYRLYELFNEMVNEYICIQVAKEVKNCGKTFVFGERNGRSKYAYGFEIFEDFLKKYQSKLIDLKMLIDTQDGAKQYFGEQNLKDLATLAKYYIEKRSELNLKLCNHIKGTKEEIEVFKFQSKLALYKIEKRIENHIAQSNTETDAKQENKSNAIKSQDFDNKQDDQTDTLTA